MMRVLIFLVWVFCASSATRNVTGQRLRSPAARNVTGKRVQALRRVASTEGQDEMDLHLPEDAVVMLHIGKTGGTALREMLEGSLHESVFMLGHQGTYQCFRACTIHPTQRRVVFVRSPIHRFVSGWISRYTRGQPDYFFPWNDEEKWAFYRFPTPNSLGRALGSHLYAERMDAERAIASIEHTAMDMRYYFGGVEHLRRCIDQVVFVGRMEHFDEDSERLASWLRSEGLLSGEPASNISRHASDDSLEELRKLSPSAVKALQEWYKEEYKILELFKSQGLLTQEYLDEVREADAPTTKPGRKKY